MSNLVLCKDCAHAFTKWSDFPFSLIYKSTYTYCRKAYIPPRTEINPVVGERSIPGEYRSADIERLDLVNLNSDRCGPEGKHWSPKHKKDIFVLLKRA